MALGDFDQNRNLLFLQNYRFRALFVDLKPIRPKFKIVVSPKCVELKNPLKILKMTSFMTLKK
jgi:hypothetical protein